MTQQPEMFEPKEMASHETSPGWVVEIFSPSGKRMPRQRLEELEGVADRVRNALYKMKVNYIEIGRELRDVKRRVTRDQFLTWVSSACGVSPRIARLLMRAADLSPSTASAPAAVRQGVASMLIPDQKITNRFVKNMVHTVKEPKPALRQKNDRGYQRDDQSTHPQAGNNAVNDQTTGNIAIRSTDLGEAVHVA